MVTHSKFSLPGESAWEDQAAGPTEVPHSGTGSMGLTATPQKTVTFLPAPSDEKKLRDALLAFDLWLGDIADPRDEGDAKALEAYDVIREAAFHQLADGMLEEAEEGRHEKC
jgi:hypothetical protein